MKKYINFESKILVKEPYNVLSMATFNLLQLDYTVLVRQWRNSRYLFFKANTNSKPNLSFDWFEICEELKKLYKLDIN